MVRLPVALAVVVAVLASAFPVRAQTLTLGAGLEAGPSPGGSAYVAVHDLRVGDDAFEAGAGGVAGAFSVAGAWRRTLTAGPLGNLVVDGRAGLDGGGWGAGASIRGVLGPVALRLDVDGGNRAPAPWPVLARAGSTPAPAPPDLARLTAAPPPWRVDAAAAATWRIDRDWTVDATPRVLGSPQGWAGGLAAGVRRGGIAPDLDLSWRFDAARGAAGGHTAVGVTLHHVPRRAPESRLTAWWGGGRHGVGPGLEVVWVARSGSDQVTLALALGPAWSDRPDAFAAAAWQRPWQGGTLALSVRALPGGTTWATTWTRPLRG